MHTSPGWLAGWLRVSRACRSLKKQEYHRVEVQGVVKVCLLQECYFKKPGLLPVFIGFFHLSICL